MKNVNISSTHISALDGRLTLEFEEVLRNLHFGEDDIVLIGGSLMDGYGSSTSDFDIYVISDESPKVEQFPAQRHHRYVSQQGVLTSVTDYMPSTGRILDTQYRTKGQIRGLQALVQGAFAQASQRTKMLINTMSVSDQRTIYRLYSAIAVQGEADFKVLMQSGLSKDQFCYLLFRNVVLDYPLLNDVAGAWRDGDFLMGCERARLFLSKSAQGLTNMFGNTNSEMKWILRALERLPDRYKPLGASYRDLMSRGLSGVPEMQKVILDCLNLSDEFYAASRGLLNSTSGFMSIEESERVTRKEIDGYRSWHRDLTREFAIRCRLFRSGLPPLVEFLPESEGERLSVFLDRSDLQPTKKTPLPVCF